ncbi:MAG: SMI1/KNR4 family protein [Nocardioidaceae bacterium]
MVTQERIVQLVHGAVRDPDEPGVLGAGDEDLEDLEVRLGHRLPPPLRQWLRICRGATIGPGGFFGNRPDKPSLDIPFYLSLFPEWKANRWLPIAGDGCGNYFVLLDSGQVGFVDTMSDPDAIEPDPYPDLLSCVEDLLGHDQADQSPRGALQER